MAASSFETDSSLPTEESLHGPTTTVTLQLLVVKERTIGQMRREIYGQAKRASKKEVDTLVILDREHFPETSHWFEIPGARKLIIPGICLEVEGIHRKEAQDGELWEVWATRITLLDAVPVSPYVAQLLSFSMNFLQQLFPDNNGITDTIHSTTPTTIDDGGDCIPQGLVDVLRPCNAARCQQLYQLASTEKAANRHNVLFKHAAILQLTEEMREYQGWLRKKKLKVPHTTPQQWDALIRMEQQFCRETSDGSIQNCESEDQISAVLERDRSSLAHVMNNEDLVYNGVNVDPSLNLPDLKDKRRQQYIAERKRPQILWMLNLIHRLVNSMVVDDLNTTETVMSDSQSTHLSPRIVRLVDIGGGRGDLANAVAAYFSQPDIRQQMHVHVTTIDINETSLQDGRARAQAANLDQFMDFVLCDLGDPQQVSNLLRQREMFDIVYGLHCCGGVAEAAVELALASQASFCVSTCCFRSNPHLASLSARCTDKSIASSNRSKTECNGDNTVMQSFHNDPDIVSALAVRVGGRGQHRAIRAINAMRLDSAEDRFRDVSEGNNARLHLQTWQESFPVEYSVQNRVLVGLVSKVPESEERV